MNLIKRETKRFRNISLSLFFSIKISICLSSLNEQKWVIIYSIALLIENCSYFSKIYPIKQVIERRLLLWEEKIFFSKREEWLEREEGNRWNRFNLFEKEEIIFCQSLLLAETKRINTHTHTERVESDQIVAS